MDYSIHALKQMKDENEKLKTSFMEYKALITACLKEQCKLLANYLKQNAEIVQNRLEKMSDLIQKYKDGEKLLKEKNNKLETELGRLKAKSLKKKSQNQEIQTLDNNITTPNEASHTDTLSEINFPSLVITQKEKLSDKREDETNFVTINEGTMQNSSVDFPTDDLIFKVHQMKTEKEKLRKDFLEYKKLMASYLEKSSLLLLEMIYHNTEMLQNLNIKNLSTEKAREIAVCMIDFGKYLIQNINLKQEIARQKASALEYNNPLVQENQPENNLSCIVSDFINIQDVVTQTDMVEGIIKTPNIKMAEIENSDVVLFEMENMLKLTKEIRGKKVNAVEYNNPIVQGNQSEDYSIQDAVTTMDITTNLDNAEAENPQDINEQKIHSCDICNQIFKTKGQKKRHITREHHPEITRNGKTAFGGKVQYTCEKCKTKFKYKTLLNNHIKSTHSENNKFKCKFCTTQTTTGYNYRRHLLRFHSHEKDPEVQDLIKSFFSSQKNKIFPTANNIAAYPCDKCTKHFTSEHSRKRHIEKLHSKSRNTNVGSIYAKNS